MEVEAINARWIAQIASAPNSENGAELKTSPPPTHLKAENLTKVISLEKFDHQYAQIGDRIQVEIRPSDFSNIISFNDWKKEMKNEFFPNAPNKSLGTEFKTESQPESQGEEEEEFFTASENASPKSAQSSDGTESESESEANKKRQQQSGAKQRRFGTKLSTIAGKKLKLKKMKPKETPVQALVQMDIPKVGQVIKILPERNHFETW